MRNVQLVSVMTFLCVLVMSMGGLPIGNAQVLNTTDTVVVVDAIGTVVGPASGGFSGGGGNVIIAFQVDPFVVAMTVRPDRLLASTFTPLWESNDCMGPPLMNVNEASGFATQMFSPVMVVAQLNPGQDFLGKVRVADPNDVTPELVTIHSTINNGIPAGCIDLDLSQDSFQATVVDTLEIMDLDALFTPPFHVEKGVKQGAQSYDLNGDGKADLVWRNTDNGDVGVWLMDGVKEVIATSVSLEWKIQP